MSDSQVGTTEARETVRLVYVGPGGKPSAFIWRFEGGDRHGELGVWKQLKARVAGAIYTVEAKNNGDTVFPGSLRFTGEYSDDAAELQVKAMAAEQEAAATRLEKNQSRTEVIDATLGGLLEIAGKLTSIRDRRALAEYVTARIMRA